jgi:hypothetical protein
VLGNGVLVRLPAVDHAVDHEPALDARRRVGRHLRRHRSETLARHEDARLAVVDDVFDLRGGEVRVDRRAVHARALRRPGDLHETLLVLHEDRHAVTGREATRAEELREPVGALVELAVRDDRAGTAHDDRGVLRYPLCDRADVHATVSTRHVRSRAAERPSVSCARSTEKGEP